MSHEKPEVFGVVWVDNMLGPLSLAKPDARSAIDTARSMRQRGADKIRDCRAVRVAAGMKPAKAFAAYRAAAALHAIGPYTRESYAKLEKARAALCAALNYPRVTDHLGEYTNLHERDIPGHRRAARQADGRYRYSGYHEPVAAEQLAEQLAVYEARSVELEKWFQTEPVERFIAGDRVLYKGFDEKCYMAQFIRAEVPHLRVNEIVDLFEYPRRMEPVMGEADARSFFANLPDPFFTAHFQRS